MTPKALHLSTQFIKTGRDIKSCKKESLAHFPVKQSTNPPKTRRKRIAQDAYDNNP